MKFLIPEEVKQLVELAQRALIELQLKEEVAFTEQEVKQYANTYSPRTVLWGKCGDINSAEYSKESLKILDYYIFVITHVIFDIVTACENDANKYSLLKDIFSRLEANGANGMARYLGSNYVPRFVDDKRLYQKMLWLEWVLNHALHLVEIGKIVDFSIPLLGGPKDQLTFRFDATKLFLDTYCEKHPEIVDELKKFRNSYEKPLQQSFDAAISVFKPPIVIEIAEVENAPGPVAIFFANKADSDDEDEDKFVDAIQPPDDVDEEDEFVDALAFFSLQDFKINVRDALTKWIKKSNEMKSEGFYNLTNDQERARDLQQLFLESNDIKYLQDSFVSFIRTGRTSSDTTTLTYSPLDISNSLRCHLIEIFCPDTFAHIKKGWLGRLSLPLSQEQIKEFLNFKLSVVSSSIPKP